MAAAPRTFRLKTLQRTTSFPKGIPYAILEGSPKISGTWHETQASEDYLIASNNLRYLLHEFFPLPVVDKDGFVKRELPRSFPNTPFGRTAPGGVMFAVGFSAEPFISDLPDDPLLADSDDPLTTSVTEGDNSANYGQLTKVTIQYEANVLVAPSLRGGTTEGWFDESKPETFCDRRLSVGGVALSIDSAKTKVTKGAVGTSQEVVANQGTTFNFTPDTEEAPIVNADKQQPLTKLIPSLDIAIHWDFNPSPDWETMTRALGTVNSKQEKLFFNLEPEMVLFMGFEGRPKYVWFGDEPEAKGLRNKRTVLWDLDYKFLGRRIMETKGVSDKVYGWNHVWSPNAQEWVRLKRGDDEEDIYRQTDFVKKLFRAKYSPPPTP